MTAGGGVVKVVEDELSPSVALIVWGGGKAITCLVTSSKVTVHGGVVVLTRSQHDNGVICMFVSQEGSIPVVWCGVWGGAREDMG